MQKLFILFLSVISLTQVSAASLDKYAEGKHYQGIPPGAPLNTSTDKIEVTEFFWYGCPHCYDFEPYLSKWLKDKPANVEFKRIPATFNKTWTIHAKAYYTAEILGILESTHQAFFDAMHGKKRRALNTPEEIAKFFAEHADVKQQTVLDTLNSFAVETKTRKAMQLLRFVNLRGVPSVMVNGKYLTSATQAGDYPTMLDIIDFLIAKENAKANGSKP